MRRCGVRWARAAHAGDGALGRLAGRLAGDGELLAVNQVGLADAQDNLVLVVGVRCKEQTELREGTRRWAAHVSGRET